MLSDWDRVRDPISVAFFDGVALFSDLTVDLSYSEQVLLPIADIYENKAEKRFKKRSR